MTPPAAKKRTAPAPAKPTAPAEPETADRKDDEPFYCPGCGRRFPFLTECRGMSEAAPHPPILVVSTDELDGDPEDHTPAPDSGA